jgi:hypothetical protein
MYQLKLVGTAHINSGAGQSQFMSHHMLSNEATRVSVSTIRVSMDVVRQKPRKRRVGQGVSYAVGIDLLKRQHNSNILRQ